MHPRQAQISAALNVVPAFADQAALNAEIERRIQFIKHCLTRAGLKTLVLGISGGIDSTTCGRLAQLAVEQLRSETGDAQYQFIAVRLPFRVQHDEAQAQEALAFLRADQVRTVNIAEGVTGLAAEIIDLEPLSAQRRDFVLGNVKARLRMVAQFAIANAHNGLVLGTDHAAEAVMGYFTKFGDGACDLAPLYGLVKSQVRALGQALGAPLSLVNKVPTGDLEELNPGKPDEEAYGLSYAEIDAFLLGQEVSERAAQIIVRTFEVTAHKRNLPLVP